MLRPHMCSEDRARLLGGLIGEMGFEAISAIENDDPQYHAMARLSRSLGPGPAMAIAILSALVSYRLPLRGEEWWTRLAGYAASKRPPATPEEAAAIVEGFLRSIRGVPLLNQKLARLRRAVSGPARGAIGDLMAGPSSFPASAARLVSSLSASLSQRPEAKTIVFAVKMAYYVYKASLGGRIDEPIREFRIPIPVDVRVACLSISSLLCNAESPSELVSKPRPVQHAWSIIAEASGIPELHLDALAWRVGWIPRDHRSVEDAQRAMAEVLSRYTTARLARVASRELAARLCRRT